MSLEIINSTIHRAATPIKEKNRKNSKMFTQSLLMIKPSRNLIYLVFYRIHWLKQRL